MADNNDSYQSSVYRDWYLCMATQKADVVLVREYGKRI